MIMSFPPANALNNIQLMWPAFPATCPPLPRMPALKLTAIPDDGRRVAGRSTAGRNIMMTVGILYVISPGYNIVKTKEYTKKQS